MMALKIRPHATPPSNASTITFGVSCGDVVRCLHRLLETSLRRFHATLHLSHKVFHPFGIGLGLKALHTFETAMGERLVTGILVEGYEAFPIMPALEPLAQSVEMHERRRLDRIYGRL